MKANELMIGDWVFYIHTEDGIAPYKEVICIQAEDLCRDACIIETHYEPIPLTAEILEKNGFARDEMFSTGWRFRYYENGRGLIYEIQWDSKNDYMEIVSNLAKIGSFDKKGIQFVHELQHALRLCGIDKEIEL